MRFFVCYFTKLKARYIVWKRKELFNIIQSYNNWFLLVVSDGNLFFLLPKTVIVNQAISIVIYSISNDRSHDFMMKL